MILVKTCTSVVLFNYRQHIFLISFIEKVELLVFVQFSQRGNQSSVSVLQNTVEKTRNIKKAGKSPSAHNIRLEEY